MTSPQLDITVCLLGTCLQGVIHSQNLSDPGHEVGHFSVDFWVITVITPFCSVSCQAIQHLGLALSTHQRTPRIPLATNTREKRIYLRYIYFQFQFSSSSDKMKNFASRNCRELIRKKNCAVLSVFEIVVVTDLLDKLLLCHLKHCRSSGPG